jgi:trimeric autotransporter adhesin
MRRVVVALSMLVFLIVSVNGQSAIPAQGIAKNGFQENSGLITSVINRAITYQGILKDNSGNPVADATYNLTFKIYNNSSGGSLLWTSAAIPVLTSDGYFSANLGTVSLPFDTTYYLSVQVQGDTEMSRQELTMAPYAARSDTANYAKAAPGGVENWTLASNILSTNGYWGLMKGNSGNVCYGDSARSIVNLGAACTTGTSGMNAVNTVIGGGRANKASANFSTVSGGYGNKAIAYYSTVSGGDLNTASGYFAVVGGGINDSAKSVASGVFSGYANTAGEAAEDTGAFVGGGIGNFASGKFSFIGGGYLNSADSICATVGGGSSNTARSIYTTVSGGWSNVASSNYSTVGGGRSNTASEAVATIGGGAYNAVSGGYSTIGGGDHNTVNGDWAVVSGGSDNVASDRFTTVGGGANNSASFFCATIAGGKDNSVSGLYATVGGGGSDSVNGVYGGVASGYSNLVGDASTDTGAFIGGGLNNSATAKYATVGGGRENTVSNEYTAIGGGSNNTASASGATIGGGRYNTASHYEATVGGGVYNTASGEDATVSGGRENVAAGDYSAIVGGSQDTLTIGGDYSMIFGRNVYINNPYRVAFFDTSYDGRLGVNRDDRTGGISYPIHVGGNSSNGNGAYLTNGGVWTNGSSRMFKENFTPFDGAELLRKISALSVTTYNYKGTAEKHVGPVAEEFSEAFDTGVIREDTGKRENQYLAAGDVAGVALAGVQELLKKLDSIERKNIELEKRNIELEKRIEKLEK